jgi:hypothetical protein
MHYKHLKKVIVRCIVICFRDNFENSISEEVSREKIVIEVIDFIWEQYCV